ncbi:preprotein translocase subunit Sec61beta [Vulcanisaeta distributa]|uniref:Preprotein translocase subunit SecG n=1 Tax=Vulcanisaeta distributa (strain DSM 14429 / JCM 11212 / NBRC 100878 / IC-017) TaxID=572478 RepID=E1QNR5_VULDI|nr:preprotein translocase subunit Sec61beta [Vulcanisaeta distributa]ADN50161.1 preprotein translocase subunit SecG [Vulcanisaeta distributa DSM 14429]
MPRRRRTSGMSPFIAAGLVKFNEAKEIERIKISPQAVIFLGIAISVIIIILKFLVPL